jgi:hypothetical protein
LTSAARSAGRRGLGRQGESYKVQYGLRGKRSGAVWNKSFCERIVMKKITVWVLVVVGLVIILCGLVSIDILKRNELLQKTVVCPVMKTQVHLISNMEYTVDHLEAQLVGMAPWLNLEKANHSLLVNESWQNHLKELFTHSIEDYETIKKLLPEGEIEKGKFLQIQQDNFIKAKELISSGLEKGDQKKIDEGVKIIQGLIEKMNSNMNWR